MPAVAVRSLLRLPRPTLPRVDKKKLGQVAGVVCGAVFLVLAVRLLQRELRPEVWHEVPAALRALPVWRVALAVVGAVLAYVWLGGFDVLSARIAAKDVDVGHAVRTGFAGYALTHNFGLSALTGMALRLHRYRRRGLRGGDVARVFLGNVVTMWTGFALALGVTVAIWPSGVWHMSIAHERAIGVALVVVVAGWIAACFKGLPTLRFRGHEFRLPQGTQALAQVSVGVVHWVLSAVILWLLLPAGVSFSSVFGALCLAQIAVVVAHVPGGVGVLEGTLLLLLRGQVDPAALAAACVLYRFTYYLLPLGLSFLMMGVESIAARTQLKPLAVGA